MSEATQGDRLPDAVAELPAVPGAVSTRPDVLAARAAVVEARRRLEGDVEQLGPSARATFDLKARVMHLPADVADDPTRAAAYGAAGLGALGAMAALIRRSRRPKKTSVLPDEIEEAVAKLGKDGEKVRETLDRAFRSYLRERADHEPPRGRGLPPIVSALVVPVAGAIAREVLRRVLPEEEDEKPGDRSS